MGICLFSLTLAYLVRFNFSIPAVEVETFYLVYPVVLGVRAMSFYLSKTYAGIIRYTGTKDTQRVFTVVTAGSLFFALLNIGRYYFFDEQFVVPFSVVIIDYLATIVLLITLRIGIKVLYFEFRGTPKDRSNVIIYGASDSAIITKKTLDRDVGTKYKIVAFVDDSGRKARKKIEEIRVWSPDSLKELLSNNDVDSVIISTPLMDNLTKADIVEKCLQFDVKVLTVPPVIDWINGELSFKQIKNVRIEDLLSRDQIKLDEGEIRRQIYKKTILVTGAAGSIGSELARQIASYKPKNLILLDQAESPLYELDIAMRDKFGDNVCEIVIGNIRSQERMKNVFETFRPQVVFHAAAYKHVPLMEDNPSESIRTNIMGTRILADLADEYAVEKFVMVSTDKAVNPTNVMGASKRIAETYVQSINRISKTKFITTRFGNVLGSNGSVIPLFRKQIEKGGPVTVTHPEITRYFMTIPEACQLVLEAGAMGDGGEIFIFDMGKSVKIVDLAKKMIKLSGLELGKDIQIRFTGLRPGEKLYEELLADKESTITTHHPQIMIAKVREYDFEEVAKNVNQLVSLYEGQDNETIVAQMKELVPEYRSQNSVYSKLDTKDISQKS